MLHLGVTNEIPRGRRLVATTPAVVPSLIQSGFKVLVEAGCGEAAGFNNEMYQASGAFVLGSRAEVFATADVVLQVRALGADPDHYAQDLERVRSGQVLIAMMNPLGASDAVRQGAQRGASLFALELIPRTGRAQQMDVLSSLATVAGYKAVLLAAEHLPKMFPLLMTAAGTITPARVLVLGVGVAGLQAIATARRLGAVVEAYDVRPAVAEQVESLGATFVHLPVTHREAEDREGYARGLPEEDQVKERDLLAQVLANHDVVITAAMVPGRRAPVLITEAMAARLAPGSVIVDLAAEQGGNCALTRAGETVIFQGITVLAPIDLPATVPADASRMFAKNAAAFVRHLVKEGRLQIDRSDDIVRSTLIAHGGEVVHPKVRERLGLPPSAKGDERET